MYPIQKELQDHKESVLCPTPQSRVLYTSPVVTLPNGANAFVQVTATWGDGCGNGSNCLYMRYEVLSEITGRRFRDDCYDDHPLIRPLFDDIPAEVRALDKYVGMYSFGPWYYFENTIYHASDKDHHGLRAGEERQVIRASDKKPMWELVAVHPETGEAAKLYSLTTRIAAEEAAPEEVRVLRWVPVMEKGVGKAPQLDYARSTAVWPEATDEELTSPDLEQKLADRLPGLVAEFRKAIEAAGFVW